MCPSGETIYTADCCVSANPTRWVSSTSSSHKNVTCSHQDIAEKLFILVLSNNHAVTDLGGGTSHGPPAIPDSQSNHSKVNAIK